MCDCSDLSEVEQERADAYRRGYSEGLTAAMKQLEAMRAAVPDMYIPEDAYRFSEYGWGKIHGCAECSEKEAMANE